MENIGIFILLIILAGCRADLEENPFSTPTPDLDGPKRTSTEESTWDQPRPTPSFIPSAYPPTLRSADETLDEQATPPAEEPSISDGPTSSSDGPTSSSDGPTSSSDGPTSSWDGPTSSSVGPTSTPIGPTTTSARPTSSTGSTPAPKVCGPVPRNIHRCIGGPKLVKAEWGQTCSLKYMDECELMSCVYEKAGWIDSDKIVIDKLKIGQHFAEIGKTQRKWLNAVKEALEKCVWEELPPQGVYLKCPAYDVTSCIEASFVRNTPPSQWSNTTECQQTKELVSGCPFCPEDCFAPLVPHGSCQACQGLARQAPSP